MKRTLFVLLFLYAVAGHAVAHLIRTDARYWVFVDVWAQWLLVISSVGASTLAVLVATTGTGRYVRSVAASLVAFGLAILCLLLAGSFLEFNEAEAVGLAFTFGLAGLPALILGWILWANPKGP